MLKSLLLSLLLPAFAQASTPLQTCQQIASSISSASEVFYPGSAGYIADNSHYAVSSSQVSTCSVEPGTEADVATIIKIIGHNRTPFAVKCGGHATNQGFSSTTGVQIALVRLNGTTYNAAANTVTVGAGVVWDQVYEYLANFNVNAVGGRVSGIGLSGFLMGGGYSWLSNQYGLGLDNIVSAQLVLPSGEQITVSATENSNIFFGIRGAYNNFGIVTSWTLKTYPQGQVWGGIIYISGNYTDEVLAATNTFATTNTDPKAELITTVSYQGGVLTYVELFYDAPTQPGVFDAFLAIPAEFSDVSTRSFFDLVQASPPSSGFSGVYNGVSIVQFSMSLLNTISSQVDYWGAQVANHTGLIGYSIEPFLSSIFNHNPYGPSAYPPERTFGTSPVNLEFFWTDPTQSTYMINAARQAHDYLVAQATILDPLTALAPLYPNYALYDTPLVDMYGLNVGPLTALALLVDPTDVMGLTGGFKF